SCMQFGVSRRFSPSRQTPPPDDGVERPTAREEGVPPPDDGMERPTEREEGVPPPEEEGRAPQPAPLVAITPVMVPRWVQLVLLPLALLGLWALARAAGPVLLILIAASTVALILNPLVKMIQRRGVPRGLAILMVYLGLFASCAGVVILL